METKIYKTKEEVFSKGKEILDKSLKAVLSQSDADEIEKLSMKYGGRRKGLLGQVVEEYFFGIKPGSESAPDFPDAGVELKTTPLKKHVVHGFSSKERLVFSMINYDDVVKETWETSAFLKKNRNLLLLFYLWLEGQDLLDYEFKFMHMLDLLSDISSEDIYQIRKDWEYIAAKVKRGEAHLLSEGDTYYLGACTKAANAMVVRDQPLARIPAKPRAFSFKQQYINYLIKTRLLGEKADTESIFKKRRRIETVEEAVEKIFAPFLGKTDSEISSMLGKKLNRGAKGYKRLIVNNILGTETGKVEELEKANVTLRAVTLESSGVLRESISFPAFDYKELANEVWQDDEAEVMADFHLQLETRKFLFVVFRKLSDGSGIVLERTLFWNFPAKDLPEAERVWWKAVSCVQEGAYGKLPKISDSPVAHVRPHAKDASDTIETPQGGQEIKRCFWLNAKYIQDAITAKESKG